MKESEELYLLRFRYGRTAEILLAYKTFLHKEVKIGEKSYCQNEEIVGLVTHTLLVTYYSFIYSLFDKSGTDFLRTTEPYLSVLTDDGREFRKKLVDLWHENKVAISKLRNNVGFHGGTKIKSQEVGYYALAELDPQISELIMTYFSLFFIELDKVVPPHEKYKRQPNEEKVKEFMLRRRDMLLTRMKDNPYLETFKLAMEELKQVYEK